MRAIVDYPRSCCVAGFCELLDWMWEEEEGLTEDYERGLLILYQPASLLRINVHAFRIEWKIQIPNIHECWISSLIAQPWIASIRGTNGENRTAWFGEGGDHDHVSQVSREWPERGPVGTENLARYLLSKGFEFVHEPGPFVELIISPIPVAHVA